LTIWDSTSDEIFDLFLRQYQKKYGTDARKWLDMKLDYFGYYHPRLRILQRPQI
jgi:hypothetical protein